MCNTVLAEISGKAWELSFLVDVVSNWVFVPQVAIRAVPVRLRSGKCHVSQYGVRSGEWKGKEGITQYAVRSR